MNLTMWIWLGAAVAFGIVEAMTVGLVSVWFALGALCALLAAALGAPLWLQILVFIVVAAAVVLAVRPLIRKFRGGSIPTNADRVVGAAAKVTETIDNENTAGAVYVDGKTWTARSADGSVIPAGTLVEVRRIEGVKLIVAASEKKAEAGV
ncbi:MAG: NfeD family protein [Oscillibacter sp.]|jgi:membrane protein implicated in regulation of membrane protease activity|nr:NfeD family protein [Oscillibacter sp.]